MRSLLRSVLSCAMVLCSLLSNIYAQDYDSVVGGVIRSDPRNQGIELTLDSKRGDLWFCVQSIEDSITPMDVFRVFLKTAERLQQEQFESVKLCYKKTEKFSLPGQDYRTIGHDLATQNVMYTVRTFPEKLVLPSGNLAFEKRRGGVLYEMKWQMRDFRAMHEQWYMAAIIADREAEKDAMRPKVFAPDEEVF